MLGMNGIIELIKKVRQMPAYVRSYSSGPPNHNSNVRSQPQEHPGGSSAATADELQHDQLVIR